MTTALEPPTTEKRTRSRKKKSPASRRRKRLPLREWTKYAQHSEKAECEGRWELLPSGEYGPRKLSATAEFVIRLIYPVIFGLAVVAVCAAYPILSELGAFDKKTGQGH